MPIRTEHIVNLQGRNYVVFPGLLNLAHESGLHQINTELIQIPSAENGNCAIVKATADFHGDQAGSTWSAYGDASPANTRGPIVAALIRMAETRAVGRVLRMSCNVGETMLEELGDDDEAGGVRANGHARPAAGRRPVPDDAAAVDRRMGVQPAGGPVYCQQCDKPISKNEQTYSQQKVKMNLCRECVKPMVEAAAKV